MAIIWTENLSVGVENIDSQHKKLFEKADQLFEAGKTGKTKDYIAQMLGFLDTYTKQHFRDEEAYMVKIGYPGIEAQKTEHKNFIAALTKLTKEYETSGGNIAVIINANQMVIEWLNKHISGLDKQIGVYAKTLK